MARRRFIFNDKDVAIFALALKQLYPTIRFMDCYSSAEPRLVFRQTLTGTSHPAPCWIVLPYDEPWHPRAERIGLSPYFRHELWRLRNFPARHFLYHPVSWEQIPKARADADWPCEWPVLGGAFGGGLLLTRYSSHDPGFDLVRAFRRKVWQVLRRIATNRYVYPGTRQQHHPTIPEPARRGDIWFGHCAFDWASKGSDRRRLDGHYRPAPDWKLPDDHWYRDLKGQVESEFGIDLGLPPNQ